MKKAISRVRPVVNQVRPYLPLFVFGLVMAAAMHPAFATDPEAAVDWSGLATGALTELKLNIAAVLSTLGILVGIAVGGNWIMSRLKRAAK